ncbi:MAG: hypothetical protein LBP95_12610 [Deltaproteobacteria bacterium]|nr:hypothetical protein [Deltaproteobacteria bacterium]
MAGQGGLADVRRAHDKAVRAEELAGRASAFFIMAASALHEQNLAGLDRSVEDGGSLIELAGDMRAAASVAADRRLLDEAAGLRGCRDALAGLRRSLDSLDKARVAVGAARDKSLESVGAVFDELSQITMDSARWDLCGGLLERAVPTANKDDRRLAKNAFRQLNFYQHPTTCIVSFPICLVSQ